MTESASANFRPFFEVFAKQEGGRARFTPRVMPGLRDPACVKGGRDEETRPAGLPYIKEVLWSVASPAEENRSCD